MAAATSLHRRVEALLALYPGKGRSEVRRMLKAQDRPRTVDPITAAEERIEERARGQDAAYKRKRAMRADKGTQIDRYHSRGSIDGPQKTAAEKLAQLFSSSGLNPKVTANWDSTFSGGAQSPGMGPTAREYMLAMQAVGIILSSVVVWVVLQDHSAESWAQKTGKPEKDGIAALRLGLDALAVHFRLRSPPQKVLEPDMLVRA
jgi:hypothetical protein